jgi:hypothetical protein
LIRYNKVKNNNFNPADIYWRRQDNAPLPLNTSIFKGNVLEIPVIRKDHRGTYFCVASNVVGQVGIAKLQSFAGEHRCTQGGRGDETAPPRQIFKKLVNKNAIKP